MALRNITDHFRYLGAPFGNHRAEWGQQRDADGTIILRVWADEGSKHPDYGYNFLVYKKEGKDKVGRRQRRFHLDMIESNKTPCFLVVCVAKNREDDEDDRGIKTFNDKEVWSTGDIFTNEDGHLCIQVIRRIPVKEFLNGLQ